MAPTKFWPLVLVVALFGCSTSPDPATPNKEAAAPTVASNAVTLNAAQQAQLQTGISQLEQKDYSSAAATLATLPSADALYMAAVANYRLGQTAPSKALLEQALTTQPAHAPSLNLRALLAREQGLFRQAETDWLAAIAADPNFAAAERNLGILYDIYLANPQQARLHYQRYFELSNDEQAKVWLSALPAATDAAEPVQESKP
ncbi:MAG TPA: hypothetical protein DCS87_15530 [Rheinheimera sp.]|nr:hypothetical protein [Rheinheimera sp.]